MAAFALSTTSLLLSCFLVRLCVGDDRILTGESLPMNETLVSGNGTFAVGFFTQGASPPRRYLGIWYNNLPGNRTVVWVANRERPFSEGSPVVLRFSNDSINDLVVTNSSGAVLWSTNTVGGGNAGARGSNMTAVLLDTGNLVLRSTENAVDVRWQSFDHPGDTVLSDVMTVWFNATSRRGNRFSSWKSYDDPAPGEFSFGIDPATALQLIVWKHNRTFYRFTPWEGDVRSTSWDGRVESTSISYFLNDSPDGVVAVQFTSSPPMLLRLYLDHNGIVRTLLWSINFGQWTALRSDQLDDKPCGDYGACGPNGVCYKSDRSNNIGPVCSCLLET